MYTMSSTFSIEYTHNVEYYNLSPENHLKEGLAEWYFLKCGEHGQNQKWNACPVILVSTSTAMLALGGSVGQCHNRFSYISKQWKWSHVIMDCNMLNSKMVSRYLFIPRAIKIQINYKL